MATDEVDFVSRKWSFSNEHRNADDANDGQYDGRHEPDDDERHDAYDGHADGWRNAGHGDANADDDVQDDLHDDPERHDLRNDANGRFHEGHVHAVLPEHDEHDERGHADDDELRRHDDDVHDAGKSEVSPRLQQVPEEAGIPSASSILWRPA